jgi:hypothetical protein
MKICSFSKNLLKICQFSANFLKVCWKSFNFRKNLVKICQFSKVCWKSVNFLKVCWKSVNFPKFSSISPSTLSYSSRISKHNFKFFPSSTSPHFIQKLITSSLNLLTPLAQIPLKIFSLVELEEKWSKNLFNQHAMECKAER